MEISAGEIRTRGRGDKGEEGGTAARQDVPLPCCSEVGWVSGSRKANRRPGHPAPFPESSPFSREQEAAPEETAPFPEARRPGGQDTPLFQESSSRSLSNRGSWSWSSPVQQCSTEVPYFARQRYLVLVFSSAAVPYRGSLLCQTEVPGLGLLQVVVLGRQPQGAVHAAQNL